MAEYIEREALKNHLMSYAGMFTDEIGCAVSLEAVLRGIDFQPAADVAHVVHGRLTNIDKNEWYCDFGKCSVCGEENPTDAKYCLGCGARMDGE